VLLKSDPGSLCPGIPSGMFVPTSMVAGMLNRDSSLAVDCKQAFQRYENDVAICEYDKFGSASVEKWSGL